MSGQTSAERLDAAINDAATVLGAERYVVEELLTTVAKGLWNMGEILNG